MSDQGCKCQKCGEMYKTDLIIPDHEWGVITGITDGSGLWCPECIITTLIEKMPNDFHCYTLVSGGINPLFEIGDIITNYGRNDIRVITGYEDDATYKFMNLEEHRIKTLEGPQTYGTHVIDKGSISAQPMSVVDPLFCKISIDILRNEGKDG